MLTNCAVLFRFFVAQNRSVLYIIRAGCLASDGGRPSGYLRLSLLCTFNHGVQHIKSVARGGMSAVFVRVVSAGGYCNGDVRLHTSTRQLPPKGMRRWRSAAGHFTRAAQQVSLPRAVVTKRLSLFGSSLAST